MRPVEPREHIEGVRTSFHGPGGSDIAPLPAVIADGVIHTEWDLSFDERQAILDGARVVLAFMGTRMPPCELRVEGVRS